MRVGDQIVTQKTEMGFPSTDAVLDKLVAHLSVAS